MKSDKYDETVKQFQNSFLNITTEGHKYLGGVIGSNRYSEVYANNLVNDWVKQIMMFREIAKSETAGFINTFAYHIRVIDGLELTLKPVDDAITQYLIPAWTDGHRCSPEERELLALPVRLGGLAIHILHNIAELGNKNTRMFCKQLTNNILKQQIRSKTSESTDIKGKR